MYEAFYGMTQRPFALKPDPSFLFMSRKHRFAFSMIEYALSGQAGFTVITGEIGSGKTTLIRHLLKTSPQDINYGIISNTHEFLRQPAAMDPDRVRHLGADQMILPARYEAFVSYLIAQYAAGRQTIIIVDEAQNLSIELLEELRLLSNINADEDQLLQMILVGQPELLEKLRRPELVQFAQRISVSYHLSPLSYFETRGYIKHSLWSPKRTPSLFTELAIKAVFHFHQRRAAIDQLRLRHGMRLRLCGWALDDRHRHRLAVIQDKKHSGLLPLYNLGGRPERQELETAIEESVAACAEDGAYDFGPPAAEESHHPVAARASVSRSGISRTNGPEIRLHDLGASYPAPVAPVGSDQRYRSDHQPAASQAERSGNLRWLFRL